MDADCCTEEDDGAIEVLSRNRDLISWEYLPTPPHAAVQLRRQMRSPKLTGRTYVETRPCHESCFSLRWRFSSSHCCRALFQRALPKAPRCGKECTPRSRQRGAKRDILHRVPLATAGSSKEIATVPSSPAPGSSSGGATSRSPRCSLLRPVRCRSGGQAASERKAMPTLSPSSSRLMGFLMVIGSCRPMSKPWRVS